MGAGVELDTGHLPGLHLQHRRGPGPGAAPGAHCADIEASVSRVGSIYLFKFFHFYPEKISNFKKEEKCVFL